MEHPYRAARKASDSLNDLHAELSMRVRLEAELFLRLSDRVQENIK